MGKIIEKLKNEARRSWNGEIGEQRAKELENYLINKLDEYSKALDVPQEEILTKWENKRSYSAINYYQEANQPSIKSDKVKLFDTVEELRQSVGKQKFRCPSCEGITTNPYECNSGELAHEGGICNWKVYGLFGHLGKGIHVFCKDEMQGEDIFMPLSWERVNA